MARLIAVYPVKNADGTVLPGEPFEGDDELIEIGAAVADLSPIQIHEPEAQVAPVTPVLDTAAPEAPATMPTPVLEQERTAPKSRRSSTTIEG
jgi:hypothetical protein